MGHTLLAYASIPPAPCVSDFLPPLLLLLLLPRSAASVPSAWLTWRLHWTACCQSHSSSRSSSSSSSSSSTRCSIRLEQRHAQHAAAPTR
jgi:hypothetical protein